SLVLTNHLPKLFDLLRKEFPSLRLTLRDSLPAGVESLLVDEVDLAISVIPPKTAPGIKVEPLMKLPLVLLTPPDSKITKFQQLLDKVDEMTNCIPETLVALPGHEALSRLFEEGLANHGIQWPATIEVNTLELVQAYVKQGYGYGVLVHSPGVKLPEGLKAIELKDFPALEIGLLHRGQLKPVAKCFTDLVRAYVAKLKKSKKK
ncbi:MAG: LysR family transcriptional regulator substrate-binding protein, partial [Verrucomicrobiota bacterium]